MTKTLGKSRPSIDDSTRGMIDVIATNPLYGTICQSHVRRLPTKERDRVKVMAFRGWQDVDWDALGQRQSGKMLFIGRLADIPEDAHSVQAQGIVRAHLIFVEDMPVESIPARVPRLNIRDPHRLHIARERDRALISAIVKRWIAGLVEGTDRHRIVDAWFEGENLVVLSPDFERLHVPVADLHRLLGSDADLMEAFEIDEDGSFLYWAHADVHLGWQQLQGIVDPTTLLAAQQRSTAFNREYGAAIRALREEHGLKQSEIHGVADRHLRRIEHGQIAATTPVLETLAKAHGMSLADYLAELAKRLANTIVF